MALYVWRFSSAVRCGQSLAHAGGAAAKAAKAEGWVKRIGISSPSAVTRSLSCSKWVWFPVPQALGRGRRWAFLQHSATVPPRRGSIRIDPRTHPSRLATFAAPPPGWANLFSRLTALKFGCPNCPVPVLRTAPPSASHQNHALGNTRALFLACRSQGGGINLLFPATYFFVDVK